jgi:hypothetical protein
MDKSLGSAYDVNKDCSKYGAGNFLAINWVFRRTHNGMSSRLGRNVSMGARKCKERSACTENIPPSIDSMIIANTDMTILYRSLLANRRLSSRFGDLTMSKH